MQNSGMTKKSIIVCCGIFWSGQLFRRSAKQRIGAAQECFKVASGGPEVVSEFFDFGVGKKYYFSGQIKRK